MACVDIIPDYPILDSRSAGKGVGAGKSVGTLFTSSAQRVTSLECVFRGRIEWSQGLDAWRWTRFKWHDHGASLICHSSEPFAVR